MDVNKYWYISKSTFIIILFAFSWCVEPYDFRIINNEPTLVIESYISNKSYLESIDFPSDGRYFEVKLRNTSDVININDQVESNAKVTLINNINETWDYTESPIGSGNYILTDVEFKAQQSIPYKLKVSLANGEEYASTWETLPENDPLKMEDIFYEEVTKQAYVYESSTEKIRDIDGVELYVNVPENNTNRPIYYKWNYTPTWVYTTSFPPRPFMDRNPICWITNMNYLSKFTIQQDNSGGYPQKLTFIETTGNHRIYKKFSLLITQITMSEEYYNFWNELEEQSDKGGLFDAPPYNLKSNFKALNASKKVSGYFGVVQEDAKRFYFNKNDLSYPVEDDVVELCNISYGPDGPGGPECYNCMEYPYGEPSNIKPDWWQD